MRNKIQIQIRLFKKTVGVSITKFNEMKK